MSNNDKFIRDTEFGKLMKTETLKTDCSKCKYLMINTCLEDTDYECLQRDGYYFAKDETDENKNLQNLQK